MLQKSYKYIITNDVTSQSSEVNQVNLMNKTLYCQQKYFSQTFCKVRLSVCRGIHSHSHSFFVLTMEKLTGRKWSKNVTKTLRCRKLWQSLTVECNVKILCCFAGSQPKGNFSTVVKIWSTKKLWQNIFPLELNDILICS